MKPSTKTVQSSLTLPWLETLPPSKILLALTLLVFLAYANALQGEFVYDDLKYIVNNYSLRQPLDFVKIFTTDKLEFTRSYSTDIPLPYHGRLFTFWLALGFRWFHLWPPGWHLLSVLLHLGVTGLIFFVLREFLGPSSPAALTAAVFAVHPMHAQSVAWISAGAHVLLSLLFLASLFAYLRARRASNFSLGLLSLVCYALALLSKESALSLPLLLFFVEWFFPKEGPRNRAPVSFVGRFRFILIRLSGFMAVSLLFLAERYQVLGFLSWQHPFNKDLRATTWLFTLPAVLWHYLRHLLFPVHLSLIYGIDFVPTAASTEFLRPALLTLLVGGGLYGLHRALHDPREKNASRALLLAEALFVIPLLPVLNLKAFHPEYLVQDRYAYLPSLGYCLVFSIGLVLVVRKIQSTARQAGFIGAVILLLLLGTARENKIWNNATRLWTRAGEHRPTSWHVHYNRGLALLNEKRFEESEKDFSRAAMLAPNNAQVFNNLGLAETKLSKDAAARDNFERAIQLNPRLVEAYINLGALEYRMQQLPLARQRFQKALTLDPTSTAALYNLARLDMDQGNFGDAMKGWNQLLQLNPLDAEVRWRLGITWRALNRPEEARQQWQQALHDAVDDILRQKILADLKQ